MEYTTPKVDVVALAEQIAEAKRNFEERERRMLRKERKIIRRSINRLIDQYNRAIGIQLIKPY